MTRSHSLILQSGSGIDEQRWRGRRVLITGGAGFIALHLAHQLLAEGATVCLLDRHIPAQLPVGMTAVLGSVLDAQALAKAAAGCDVVYHLAAELGVEKILSMPRQVLEVNIVGTVRALTAAQQAGASRFVLASSSEVYGEGSGRRLQEHGPLQPVSIYGLSKIMAEQYCRGVMGASLVGTPEFSRLEPEWVHEAHAMTEAQPAVPQPLASQQAVSQHSVSQPPASRQGRPLEVTIVRLFNVYGPGQREDFVVPRFVSRVAQGLPPVIYGDGQQVRVYTHVRDVVAGLSRMGWHRDAASEVFNLGGSQSTSLRALAQAVSALGKQSLPPLYQPLGEGIRSHSREIFHRVPDSTHLLKRLNFQASISLEEGLRQLYASYRRALSPERPGLRQLSPVLLGALGGFL